MKKGLVFLTIFSCLIFVVIQLKKPESFRRYNFKLNNIVTTHQKSNYISLEGIIKLNQYKGDIIFEFEKVKGLYESDIDKTLKDSLKRPILIKKGDRVKDKLIGRIIYYLTLPFPNKNKMTISHPGVFGQNVLVYKSGKGSRTFNIEKFSKLQNLDKLTGKFSTSFDHLGYINTVKGTDEDFISDGKRVLSKSKIEFSFSFYAN